MCRGLRYFVLLYSVILLPGMKAEKCSMQKVWTISACARETVEIVRILLSTICEYNTSAAVNTISRTRLNMGLLSELVEAD